MHTECGLGSFFNLFTNAFMPKHVSFSVHYQLQSTKKQQTETKLSFVLISIIVLNVRVVQWM